MLQTNLNQSPLQYEVEVGEQGQIQLQVPFTVGQKIVVLVMEPLQDNIDDLVAASTSSLVFWDNNIDAAEWPAEILNYQGDREFPAFESSRDELLPLSQSELF
jgi:hypothetical protein